MGGDRRYFWVGLQAGVHHSTTSNSLQGWGLFSPYYQIFTLFEVIHITFLEWWLLPFLRGKVDGVHPLPTSLSSREKLFYPYFQKFTIFVGGWTGVHPLPLPTIRHPRGNDFFSIITVAFYLDNKHYFRKQPSFNCELYFVIDIHWK